MLNVSAERCEDALAFQRELVAVVDKWVSRVEASDGDAFIKELLGYYRIRRMLVDSLNHVEFARRCNTAVMGGRGGGKAVTVATTEMTDLSSKTAALIAAASTGATLARIASDKARLLASQK